MAENWTLISRDQGLIYNTTIIFILLEHICYKYERLFSNIENFNTLKIFAGYSMKSNILHFRFSEPQCKFRVSLNQMESSSHCLMSVGTADVNYYI